MPYIKNSLGSTKQGYSVILVVHYCTEVSAGEQYLLVTGTMYYAMMF